MTNSEFDNEIYFKLIDLFEYKSISVEVQKIIDRGFVAAKYKDGKALFIGINPSYTADATPESFLYDINEAVLDYPKHYAKFSEIVRGTKYEKDWTYIDLFQFRETNQKKLNCFFKNDIQFIVEQLRLSHKIITKINPEVIIVCNSEATNFFGIEKLKQQNGNYTNVWFGYDFIFDGKYGVDMISRKILESIIDTENEIEMNTPIIFTSTLTYMSKYDKRRLNWQIKMLSER